MRLGAATLAGLPAAVRRPAYDFAAQKAGIVHFGIGAFHRAHQAVFCDDVMNGGERDWRIVGVSLRSADVAEQLNPQDGLYSLATRAGRSVDYRVVGAIERVLVAGRDAEQIARLLSAPHTHVVTLTITEKGYCRAADGNLDTALAHDGSAFARLSQGLLRRMRSGLPGLTLLSCDNLAHNGAQLQRLFGQYLDLHDAALRSWVEANCTFPSSMVDRIVPATTAGDRDAAAAILGVRDEAHVVTEGFRQWVIEDRFAGSHPHWEHHGAELVSDVRPYETAKLRMLNGAHSALAYIGLLRGHEFVHEAMADPGIRPLVEHLMREEAMPSIAAGPRQDLVAYADALLGRFANTALNHRLQQIAMDGSQKLPQRWLPVLVFHQRSGRTCPAILRGIAAWLRHVRGHRLVDDPLQADLAAAWARHGNGAVFDGVFGMGGLLASEWKPSEADRKCVADAMRELEGVS